MTSMSLTLSQYLKCFSDCFTFPSFIFGDFNIYHKDWLTYSDGTDRLVNSVIIFISQMTLLRWLTFPLGSLTVTLTVLFFWFFFLSSDASVCSTMPFPPLGNSDHVLVLVY